MKAGELALPLNSYSTWESRSYTLPDRIVQTPVEMGTNELSLPLFCYEVAWLAKRCPLPPPRPLPPEAIKRADLDVMMVGELSIPLTSYSTWESWPCALPGQNSTVSTGWGVAGGKADPAPGERIGKVALTLICHEVAQA